MYIVDWSYVYGVFSQHKLISVFFLGVPVDPAVSTVCVCTLNVTWCSCPFQTAKMKAEARLEALRVAGSKYIC